MNQVRESIFRGIRFSWDPPANAPVGVIYTLYEHSSSAPFSSATELVVDTAQTSIIVPRSHTNLRYFWIKSKDPATGRMSTHAPPSNGLPAAATSASGALAALVSPGSASAIVYSANATTNSVTVTPTGGSSPYTYAWSWLSGGTGIDIDSASSATTTFSESSSLSQGDHRTGVAECLVTDNLGATATVQVSVTIAREYEITLVDQFLHAFGGSVNPAVVTWTISPGGHVSKWSGSSLNTQYRWLDPAADPADYDVRFTQTDGSALQYGVLNTWLQLNTGHALVGVRNPGAGIGTSFQRITVEVRLHDPPNTVLASCDLILSEQILGGSPPGTPLEGPPDDWSDYY